VLAGSIFVLNIQIQANEIGFAIGPIANEESLISKTLHERLYFYDFPIFIGGPYIKRNLSENHEYYTDLQISIHPVNSQEYRINPVLTYHHQEVRWLPWESPSIFLGGGLEFIWIYRNYQNNETYNFYNSTHFYPYLSIGLKTDLKVVKMGTILRGRIGVEENKMFDGSGELTIELTF
jgi:hypothetical protein